MNTLEKAKWISVLILIILLLALAALGVWQLHLANERLLSLKERAAGLSDRVIQPSPEPEPEAGSTPPAPMAKKRTLCSFLALFPIIAFSVAEFLVPLGVLGISEFQNALTMLH